MAGETKRYTAVAIALHWLIAVAIFSMIPIGWWMSDAIHEPETRRQAFETYQIHKSVGLTVLALSVLRLLWRLAHKPPPLPENMGPLEKFAANAVHALLYVVMIGLPLSGWAYVSAGWSFELGQPFSAPTIWFGLFETPHLPGFAALSDGARALAAQVSMSAHSALAWGAIVLGGVHVAAALKHHFLNRDAVLSHMVPFLKPLRRATPPPAA